MTGIEATAETSIAATPARVWTALTDPEQIAQYMFGSTVATTWQPGDPITWSGEFDGKSYTDKGEIVTVEPDTLLEVTHYSPLGGAEDVPENYHHLRYVLTRDGDGTTLSLTQDNNGSEDEAAQATKTWEQVLAGIKKVVESGD